MFKQPEDIAKMDYLLTMKKKKNSKNKSQSKVSLFFNFYT